MRSRVRGKVGLDASLICAMRFSGRNAAAKLSVAIHRPSHADAVRLLNDEVAVEAGAGPALVRDKLYHMSAISQCLKHLYSDWQQREASYVEAARDPTRDIAERLTLPIAHVR